MPSTGVTLTSEIHDEIGQRLALVDQRYTRHRRVLIETMASAGRPLTIPEILETNPGLPQSSAYRNMAVLIDAGAARRVNSADDHGCFELAEHLSEHHHHLVCRSCGKVSDVRPSPRLERALAETALAVGDENGFEITEHRLDLVGTCADCRAGEKLNQPADSGKAV